MTGERELLAGESASGGEPAAGAPDCVRPGCEGAGGAVEVKKPTWRTLGSITARELRRASIGA